MSHTIMHLFNSQMSATDIDTTERLCVGKEGSQIYFCQALSAKNIRGLFYI